jgi:putative aldouronate transport system substrate-binding protein
MDKFRNYPLPVSVIIYFYGGKEMKRSITGVLIVLMCLSVLGGVYAGGGSQDASSGEKPPAGFNKTGYPIVDQKVSYTAWGAFDNQSDPNSTRIMQELESKTNVHIEWTVLSNAALTERKNLMWASGEYPDMLTNGSVNSGDVIRYGAGEGILQEIQDLIPQYMPNLMKAVETEYPNLIADITLQNGKIYSLPRISPFYQTGAGIYINKTWLDKLNLKIPVTTDDLIHVLRAFRDNDVNGNGDKNDEIPFSWANVRWDYSLSHFMGIFGKACSGDNWIGNVTDLLIENGKVVMPVLSNEFKDGITYLNQLYREKLIDPEVFTQDEAAFNAKGKNKDQLYGCILSWRIGMIVGDDKADQYVLVPPLKYKNITPEWGRFVGVQYEPAAAAFTNKAKNIEILLRYFDYLCDPYMGEQIRRGMVGEFMKFENNTFIMNPTPQGYATSTEWQRAKAVQFLPFISSSRYQSGFQTTPSVAQMLAKDAAYKAYQKQTLYPYVWLTGEQNDLLSPIKSDMKTYINQMIASWISGEQDINATWNTYLGQLDKLGLKTYLDTYQKIYDGKKK